jgi:hypothetical protein
MNINLFIDDQRRPYDSEWLLATNAQEALSFMRSDNRIVRLSMDWHLGLNQPTGEEVLRKMLTHTLARLVFGGLREAYVHTSSGSGRRELHMAIRDAQRYHIIPQSCAIIDNPTAMRHPETLK